MQIPQHALYELFDRALKAFMVKDAANIRDNAAERNLCARLGYQFESMFPDYKLAGYFADPEYNRKQDGEIKTIINGEYEVIQVTCDLILHSRGEQEPDNLIAIEMAKPDKTAQQVLSDRHRLMALTKRNLEHVWSFGGKVHPEHVCGYLLGAFILVDRVRNLVSVEFFEDGNSVGKLKLFHMGGV